MQIITLSFWFKFLLVCSSFGIAHSDNLTLDSNNRLQGQISAINQAGLVELATEISPDKILIKSGVVRKIDFNSNASPSSELSNAFVRLINGDLLPVTLVSLNETKLEVTNRDIGLLKIPRTSLKSLSLVSNQKKIIYNGPKNLNEWIGNDAAIKSWQFANDFLTTDGPASAYKEFAIPTNFSLKFTLKWKGDPSLKIFFAETMNLESTRMDRYCLIFNSSGLEIFRESSKSNHLNAVILMPWATPDHYPENQLAVEIHVNREKSRVELLINGEPKMGGIDSISNIPKGNKISFLSDAPLGITQEIGYIEISDLSDSENTNILIKPEDTKFDNLVSSNGDYWSGRLIAIDDNLKENVLKFKSDFQDEPLEIDAAEITAIMFAKADQLTNFKSSNDYALKLQDNGLLTMTSCVFLNDHVSAEHQLLGPIKIKKSGITAMEWIRPEIEDETKERTEK